MVIPCSRLSHTQLLLPRKSIFQGSHQGSIRGEGVTSVSPQLPLLPRLL